MQPWENDKNSKFGPNLGPLIFYLFFLWVLPLLIVKQCFKLSFYGMSRKNNEPNLKKTTKNLTLSPQFIFQFYLY